MKFCCDKFAEHAGVERPTFERDGPDTWLIRSCCGSNMCCVVDEMRFCPYCGSDVTTTPAEPEGGES